MIMKVLIIEDDEYKAKQVYDFVVNKYDPKVINIKSAFQSGMEEVVTNTYDLLILDMSITSFDQNNSRSVGRYRHYGGRDILEEMHRKDIVIPTIVVTQFTIFGEGEDQMTGAQLDDMLRREYPDNYFGIVLYKGATPNWKEELSSKIDIMLKGKQG